MWDNLYTEGDVGSEDGEVIFDEEYKASCRITLEKCERHYAITCGVYGAMVHTVFSDADSCFKLYDTMKNDLQEFINKSTNEEEEIAFYAEFTSKY